MVNRRRLGVPSLASFKPVEDSGATKDEASPATPFLELGRLIPKYQRFPTLSEVRGRMHQLAADNPGLVTIREIGRSRKGLPIELVSIGTGGRSALVVAGVHANEPVGSLTVDFLASELVRNDHLRKQLGYSWHFINPIDPDGMNLNEGWLKAPLTPESYFRFFARPALGRQPDYSFPLQVGDYKFDDSPPENRAFQRAIELVRPRFQYVLHNSEYGGAFFLTSRSAADLETALQAIPERFGVYLSPIGELLSELPIRARGVFAFPRPAEMVRQAQAAGADPRRVWPVGDTSMSFSDRFDTFSFVAEVPYWTDQRVFDQNPSQSTLAAILADYVGWLKSGESMLVRARPKLKLDETIEPELFWAATENIDQQLDQRLIVEGLMASSKLPHALLSISDALIYRTSLRMVLLRPFVLLARVAETNPDPGLAQLGAEASAFVAESLRAIRAEAQLNPLPLRSTVGVQAISGLAAAHFAALG